jgi:hypothetical protein
MDLRSLARLLAASFGFFCIAAFPAFLHAADDDKAEIKLLVAPAGIDKAMKALPLASLKPEHYRVYFADTKDLRLIGRGVILRLRDKGKKDPETETTVKFRPDDQSKAPDLKLPKESKKETEWLIMKGQNVSYSLKNEIKGTNLLECPDKNLDILFSAEQKAFFELIMGEKFDPAHLRVFGPIPADVWEWKDADVEDDVSAELWKLGDEQIFELSRKAKADNLDKKAEKFAAAFEKKVTIDANPESKTRKAMQHFAKAEP